MTSQMVWQIDGDLSDIAKMAQSQYYSVDQSGLLTCPDELKARCWELLAVPAEKESAATILMLVARVAWEGGRDLRAAMELKRLFENCLKQKSALTDKIVRSLTSHAQQQMHRIMRDRAISADLVDTNPMSAVEQCFFGLDESADSYLMGGLLLTGYRNVLIDCEPTGFLASLFAIREAFAYFRAGQAEAAISSLVWARPAISKLEPDMVEEQYEMIGRSFAATARAADIAEKFDDSIDLWYEALRFLPRQGDDHAQCHFYIGEELQRRGDRQGAVRAYQAALDTPSVCDAEFKMIVKAALSMIRAQLESDPKHLRLDEGLIGEFGSPKDFPRAMQQILRQLSSGERIPDADTLKGIATIREWIDWQAREGLTDGRTLSMLVLLLKLCLSLDDQTNKPVEYSDLLLQCEKLIPVGDDSTCIEYQTIREHVLQRFDLSTEFEFAKGRQPRQAEEIAVLHRIAAMTDPAKRLDPLRVFAVSECLSVTASCDPVLSSRQFPLSDVLSIAIDGVAAVRQRLITAEESGFLRSSVDELLRCLSVLLFMRFEALTPNSVATGRATVQKSEVDHIEWNLIVQYCQLLQSMANWRLSFCTASHFCNTLNCLAPEEIAEFTRIRESLAECLRDSFAIPTVLQNPVLPRNLDRVRELRTLAQAASKLRTESKCLRSVPKGCASIALVELSRAPRPLLGIIGLETDRIHLWWSEHWSESAIECHRLLQNFDVQTGLFDQLTATIRENAEFQLNRMLLDDADGACQIQGYHFENLTAYHVPFDCLSDSTGRCRTMSGLIPGSGATRQHSISFWGAFQFRSSASESTDETFRVVKLKGRDVLRYPDLPQNDVRQEGNPTPLPYAHYERWLLEDLSRKHGIPVDIHTGDAATRSDFLTADRSAASVLHITTHGFAQPTIELSNLMFSQEGGSPSRVHFLDILSGDWSNLELVFLNVCLSQAGRKLVGESALSLAWAFIAGGAKSVIAYRWQVEDSLAWCFAQIFYERWLIEKPGSTVREAFHHARFEIQQRPQFRQPSQWGALVLLEPPDGSF